MRRSVQRIAGRGLVHRLSVMQENTPYITFTENVLMVGFSGRFFFIILYKNRLFIQIYSVKNIPDRMLFLCSFW
jgi:hypothetical protein